MGGGEDRAERRALGDAERHGTLAAGGVQDHAHVVHALLERGEAVGGTRSESPVPRLSHMITRPNVPSRRSQRVCAGCSQALWKEPIQPNVTRMSRSPSPKTS